jgi:hypothetical protein
MLGVDDCFLVCEAAGGIIKILLDRMLYLGVGIHAGKSAHHTTPNS